VRAPEEAGEGKAKVTFSFPAWMKDQVTPASFKVDVVRAFPKSDMK